VASARDVAQILTNLVMNALAHAPRGTEVTLSADASDTVVTVEVEDDGPGIDLSRATSVFEGDSRREGGAGVGLRHARGVARTAGGDLILVPSNQGACFRLRWPRVDVPGRAPMSAARVSVLAGRRVLILEDDADVVTLLETALGARGAEVSVARSRAELESAAKAEYDAALIDLSPIASDVGGAIASLRGGSPDVKLVFISGSAAGIPAPLLLPAGGGPDVRWVRKPFEIAEVVAALLEPKKDP
jgi:CheY-like chemotaxis protein